MKQRKKMHFNSLSNYSPCNNVNKYVQWARMHANTACYVRAGALDKRLTVDAELIAERLLAFRAYHTYLFHAFRSVPVRTPLFNQVGHLTRS